MRAALFSLILVHAGIHLLGFVKGLGLAEIQQLRQPISPTLGFLWLVAAGLLGAGGGLLLADVRPWWAPTLAGIVISQLLIAGNWADARAGTLANLVILVPVLVSLADLRPSSLRTRYRDAVASAVAAEGVSGEPRLVSEADLAGLPEPVTRWLRHAGVVGHPRVHGLHVRFEAAIRDGADDAWMTGTAEQYSFLAPPVRLFFMDVTRRGLPVDVYHRYAPGGATMEARVGGVIPVLDEAGPELDQSETVTFLNDVFLLAPGAVPFLELEWEQVGTHRVVVRWRNDGHRVSATLVFSPDGDLMDFSSDDRFRSDEGIPVPMRWSTPIRTWQELEGVRLPREAEARWGTGEAAWTYARFVVREVRYDLP